ncbi:hypothetical protein MATL_G00032880 [Megalops atlanticus]|uniref:Uncharacterized protein n=1 Tax=Megalops atlanticus TaxID=7932 RepID=A0A9D3QEE9_MEGAT|nr:hypothetical protein MATL_G00032880 [Megalops atlanticus]
MATPKDSLPKDEEDHSRELRIVLLGGRWEGSELPVKLNTFSPRSKFEKEWKRRKEEMKKRVQDMKERMDKETEINLPIQMRNSFEIILPTLSGSLASEYSSCQDLCSEGVYNTVTTWLSDSQGEWRQGGE